MPKSHKSDVKLGTGCVVCEECMIEGDVTIGSGTVVHPMASILAESGPIIIGENNIIEEKSVIRNTCDSKSGSTPVMIIGNHNVFEVGCNSEALKIGDNNVLEMKCVVGREVVLSNNCVVGAGCVLTHPEALSENCGVSGEQCLRRITQGHQPQSLQRDHLAKVLPNYHRIMRKQKKSSNLTNTPTH